MWMKAKRRTVWGVVTLGVLLLGGAWTPAPTQAEWSFEAYIGGAFLPEGDLQELDGLGRSTTNFDDAFLVGGRLGYWLHGVPYLGVALDVSYYATELEALTSRQRLASTDLNRVLLSGLARLRLPLLQSRIVPQGHLEPYIAAGPTLAVANLDLDDIDDSQEDIGIDARGGLNVRLTRTVGIFAEYRYTWIEQTFKFSRAGLQSLIETDPSTHHILGGLSFRF